MLRDLRANRSWLWAFSALMTACAIIVSYGLSGHLSVPDVDWLPDRAEAEASPDDPSQWRPVPSVAAHGWLTESRRSSRNAFNVRRSSVRVSDILDMPPGVDDIPALDNPRCITSQQQRSLRPDDEVIGVTVGDAARCYPLAILRWHCVVNDVLGGQPICLLFDPLSGASLGFSRAVGGDMLSFGVSGKAYNGATLLYDREHRNLWSPLTGECIAGPWTGRCVLGSFPVEPTYWASWLQRHPQTTVLSRNTGIGRPYDLDPYAQVPRSDGEGTVNYWQDPGLILAPPLQPVPQDGPAPKTMILAVRPGDRGATLAFVPPAGGNQPLSVVREVDGRRLRITWDPRPASRTFTAVDDRGQSPRQVTCFWFAWYSAYPQTQVVYLQGSASGG